MTGVATTTFEYKVRNRAGELQTGKVEAESQSQVVAQLKQQGLAPVSIVEANVGMQREIKIPGFG